jgi:MFS superfamily sulfate permease-like transporter
MATWARRRFPVVDWLPEYRFTSLGRDLAAGTVLAAMLVPAGMGYAEASGLPTINGLYATLAALVAYALMGPSRVLVLGPDSSLVPIVAATVIPLAAGDPQRSVALGAALAGLAGVFCLIAGFARLGFLTDLLSMPIRIGYLNGIALTLLIGQLPKLFGFPASGDDFPSQLSGFVDGLSRGATNLWALSMGGGALVVMLLLVNESHRRSLFELGSGLNRTNLRT